MNDIIDVETEIIDESEEEVIDFTYSITSYGADYPVDSLIKRMTNNSIVIPGFQRKFVWSITQASRFMESLLLGLPVPGIFFSKETGSSKLMVIDGQQRNITNLKYSKIQRLLETFSPDWKNEYSIKISDIQKDALDSIIANRNQIAHGQSVGITFVRVLNYYKEIKKVINTLKSIIVKGC